MLHRATAAEGVGMGVSRLGRGRGSEEGGRETHEGRETRRKEGTDGRLPLKGWRCDCAREKLDQVRTSAVLEWPLCGPLSAGIEF